MNHIHYSSTDIADGDQFYASIDEDIDAMVEGCRHDLQWHTHDRVTRLDNMARHTAKRLPDAPEITELVYWFVTAIDRLARLP